MSCYKSLLTEILLEMTVIVVPVRVLYRGGTGPGDPSPLMNIGSALAEMSSRIIKSCM